MIRYSNPNSKLQRRNQFQKKLVPNIWPRSQIKQNWNEWWHSGNRCWSNNWTKYWQVVIVAREFWKEKKQQIPVQSQCTIYIKKHIKHQERLEQRRKENISWLARSKWEPEAFSATWWHHPIYTPPSLSPLPCTAYSCSNSSNTECPTIYMTPWKNTKLGQADKDNRDCMVFMIISI